VLESLRREYRVTGVAHTGITVADLSRSIRFYRDGLGFEVSPRFPVRSAQVGRITGIPGAALDVAFVRAPNHFLELLCFTHPRGGGGPHLRPCDPGFFHLCLKVRNISAVLKAMHSFSFAPLGSIETITEGPSAGMQLVYLRDPDGIHLELAEDAPGIVFEELFFPRAASKPRG
jgi:catechol 2,3-dioxygenase-like lactoylglutathione lyase family enzyme